MFNINNCPIASACKEGNCDKCEKENQFSPSSYKIIKEGENKGMFKRVENLKDNAKLNKNYVNKSGDVFVNGKPIGQNIHWMGSGTFELGVERPTQHSHSSSDYTTYIINPTNKGEPYYITSTMDNIGRNQEDCWACLSLKLNKLEDCNNCKDYSHYTPQSGAINLEPDREECKTCTRQTCSAIPVYEFCEYYREIEEKRGTTFKGCSDCVYLRGISSSYGPSYPCFDCISGDHFQHKNNYSKEEQDKIWRYYHIKVHNMSYKDYSSCYPDNNYTTHIIDPKFFSDEYVLKKAKINNKEEVKNMKDDDCRYCSAYIPDRPNINPCCSTCNHSSNYNPKSFSFENELDIAKRLPRLNYIYKVKNDIYGEYRKNVLNSKVKEEEKKEMKNELLKNVMDDLNNSATEGGKTAAACVVNDILVKKVKKVFGKKYPKILSTNKLLKRFEPVGCAMLVLVAGHAVDTLPKRDLVLSFARRALTGKIRDLVEPYMKEVVSLFTELGNDLEGEE